MIPDTKKNKTTTLSEAFRCCMEYYNNVLYCVVCLTHVPFNFTVQVEVLSTLSHRNIVQFYGAVTEEPNFSIVTGMSHTTLTTNCCAFVSSCCCMLSIIIITCVSLTSTCVQISCWVQFAV